MRAAGELLRGQADDQRHTLARSDTTSATLLTLATALLAGLGGAAAIVRPRLTVVPVTVAAVGTVALVGAVLCALAAIRPRSGTGGPPVYADRDPEEVTRDAAGATSYEVALREAHEVVSLARIACRKHRLQRHAVDLLGAAVLLYTAAAVAALIT